LHYCNAPDLAKRLTDNYRGQLAPTGVIQLRWTHAQLQTERAAGAVRPLYISIQSVTLILSANEPFVTCLKK